MDLSLLVLAAGIGSRYGGLKQIDPVGPGGETIIDYSIYDAIRAGFNRVVFVIRPDIEADFRQIFGRKFADKIAVDYAYQQLSRLPEGFSVPANRQKPWGTGHAVLSAAGMIHEPFVAINADDFYGAAAFRQLAGYLRQQVGSQPADEPARYAMVGFRLGHTLSEFGSVSRGICRADEANFLQEIVEITGIAKQDDRIQYTDAAGQPHRLAGETLVSMNIWGFTPTIFDYLQSYFVQFLEQAGANPKAEFYIPTVVNSLISQGAARVKVLPNQARWFGVTYPEDKAYVAQNIRALVDQGLYPESVWE